MVEVENRRDRKSMRRTWRRRRLGEWFTRRDLPGREPPDAEDDHQSDYLQNDPPWRGVDRCARGLIREHLDKPPPSAGPVSN
jgi:hypothetical protein